MSEGRPLPGQYPPVLAADIVSALNQAGYVIMPRREILAELANESQEWGTYATPFLNDDRKATSVRESEDHG